jgi:hypothetical protein
MESFFEQPRLPAVTTVMIMALKPIDINLLLPKIFVHGLASENREARKSI